MQTEYMIGLYKLSEQYKIMHVKPHCTDKKIFSVFKIDKHIALFKYTFHSILNSSSCDPLVSWSVKFPFHSFGELWQVMIN